MPEFTHSIVLFSGDDGLPLEFNIQNTVDKASLKAMIEHGGGLCTLSDDAIHLVSPGTKVLNIDHGKKVISSRYIFDCVKENYLLDISDYKIEINEMETSDLSGDSLNFIEKEPKLVEVEVHHNPVDVVDANRSPSPDLLSCPNNNSFDFEDNEIQGDINNLEGTVIPVSNCPVIIHLDRGESHKITLDGVSTIPNENLNPQSNLNVVPDSIEDHYGSFVMGQNLEACENELSSNKSEEKKGENASAKSLSTSAVIVSSSQPNADDQFDNMLLNKLQEKPDEEEELSQSYTVSSSADALPSKPSPHNTSAEIFEGSAALPDSASQSEERQQYITNLENEIKKILQKPSPKSIQDKTTLVKYICVVKKLAPAVVLQTLQKF